MKLVVNMVMGTMMASFAEGITLASKAGLNPEDFIEVGSSREIQMAQIANPCRSLIPQHGKTPTSNTYSNNNWLLLSVVLLYCPLPGCKDFAEIWWLTTNLNARSLALELSQHLCLAWRYAQIAQVLAVYARPYFAISEMKHVALAIHHSLRKSFSKRMATHCCHPHNDAVSSIVCCSMRRAPAWRITTILQPFHSSTNGKIWNWPWNTLNHMTRIFQLQRPPCSCIRRYHWFPAMLTESKLQIAKGLLTLLGMSHFAVHSLVQTLQSQFILCDIGEECRSCSGDLILFRTPAKYKGLKDNSVKLAQHVSWCKTCCLTHVIILNCEANS